MVDAVTEALQLIADIDRDHMHAFHDPLNPRHREAVRCYQELAEFCFNELNRVSSCDYPIHKGSPPPPALIERRPGFRPP